MIIWRPYGGQIIIQRKVGSNNHRTRRGDHGTSDWPGVQTVCTPGQSRVAACPGRTPDQPGLDRMRACFAANQSRLAFIYLASIKQAEWAVPPWWRRCTVAQSPRRMERMIFEPGWWLSFASDTSAAALLGLVTFFPVRLYTKCWPVRVFCGTDSRLSARTAVGSFRTFF